MHKTRFVLAVLLPLLAVVAWAQAPVDEDVQPLPAAAQSAATPADEMGMTHADIDDIRRFARVYTLVKQAYVEPETDASLMDAAIQGMLSRLDPHSAFLDQRQLQQLSEDTSGEYAGLGIQVADVGGQLRVITPLDDTPAARAGLRPGDIILSIDGTAVVSENVDTMVDRLRGPPGSQVTLSIQHDPAEAPRQVVLTRERIRIASVRTQLLEPGYVLLRISEFQQGTTQSLNDALTGLRKQGALRGVVLDLRNNPGGLLTAAVGVSDLFLDEGGIVSTRGRTPQADLQFNATAGDLLDGAPLVVLVNAGTASAAEIVAGALKDNHRALIMGQRTFGKGSVQSVLQVDDDHAVKLTTARYFTPSGVSIQAEGIRPDITLGDLTVNPRETAPSLIVSEADLPNHLVNSAGMQVHAPTPLTDEDAQLALDDYALSEALNVLKGMALSRHGKPASTGTRSE